MTENTADLSIILTNSSACSESTLQASRKDIQGFFTKLPIKYEVLEPRQSDLKQSILSAQGAFCFLMNAELTHPLAEIIVFLTHFTADSETQVIHGSRGLDPRKMFFRETHRQRFVRQKLGAWIQSFCRLQVSDPLCQFQAFRKPAAHLIFEKQRSQIAVNIEALVLAKSLKLKIETLPIRSSASEANLNFWGALKLFWELFSLNLRVYHSKKD